MLDRNRFLLIATALASATTTDAVAQIVAEPGEEMDGPGGCDDTSGQTGRAKYCPIAEGAHHGCLDWGTCQPPEIQLGDRWPGLKAGSELRYFDCLANASVASCTNEGAGGPWSRCASEVVTHACSDSLARLACERLARSCPQGGTMMDSCASWLAPLDPATRQAFVACIEGDTRWGCDDAQFRQCLIYLRPR